MKKACFLHLFVAALWVSVSLLLTSCSSDDDADAAMKTAQRFAKAYFNHDFHQAEQYATPESRKWLRFAASNTTQHDLDLTNERHARVEVEEMQETDADTLMLVHLSVSDYVKPALLGRTSERSEKSAVFPLTLVRRDGRWQVRLESLPRSTD